MMTSTNAPPAVLVFGTGGQAKVTFDAILRQGAYVAAFFVVDDRPVQPGETFLSLPVRHLQDVLGDRSPNAAKNFIVAIGDNATRRAKQLMMVEHGFEPATVVHPTASIGQGCQIGAGTLICAGAIIDPEVEIGAGAIINGGGMIGHESRFGDFTHHGPAALVAGDCRIGELAFVGLGAMVLSRISVGREAFVAAGALVTKNVPDGMMAIGIPARFRQRISHRTP